MKRIISEISKALIMGLLVPGIMLSAAMRLMQPSTYGHAAAPDPTITTQIHTLPPGEARPDDYTIRLHSGNDLSDVDLEEYLVGVVLAEMPASFEIEALKAQAVAARTYAMRCCAEGKRHGENAICTNHACCQAYISPETYVGTYGTRADMEKVRSAVYQTAGQVLTYGGELITAAYFSCSGGTTEDAVAVWGYDIPYLQSVESPGEEAAPVYSDTVEFTPEQFCAAMAIRLTGKPNTWFGDTVYTDGGGVSTMTIGGVCYRGTTLRTLLGLRSTAFSVRVSGEKIIFTTSGFGHRVGMSQYGADAMAASGSTYDEILTHYYSGAKLTQYPEKLI